MRNLVSPVGTIAFGSVIEPRVNPNSGKLEWNIGIRLNLSDSEVMLGHVATALGEKRKADPSFPTADDKLSFPYRPGQKKNEKGEKEVNPDEILWTFKRNTQYKNKAGEITNNPAPRIYDSLGRIVNGKVDRIGGGTTGKVVFDVYVFNMPGTKGVSLQFTGFQIAELRINNVELAPIEGGWVPEEHEIDSIAAALAGDA